MKRWFAKGGHAGGEHQHAQKEEADIERVDLDGEEHAGQKIDRAPDDSEDRGVADFLAGADDEEGLVFVSVEGGISLHEGSR